MIPPKNPPTEEEATKFLASFYNVSEKDIKQLYQDEIDAYLRLFTLLPSITK